MGEILIVKGRLKVTKAIIEELEKNSYSHGEEIVRLDRELSMTRICKSDMVVRFDYVEKRAYEIEF